MRPRGDCVKVIGNFAPVVHPNKTGCCEIVRRSIEQSLAFEASEIPGLVVDEIVGAEDGLVTAEDVVRGRDEGKMSLQPSVFGAEGVGHGHGLRGDEDFKAGGEVFEHLLRVGNQSQVLEEVFSVEEGAKLLLAVEGRDLP